MYGRMCKVLVLENALVASVLRARSNTKCNKQWNITWPASAVYVLGNNTLQKKTYLPIIFSEDFLVFQELVSKIVDYSLPSA